MLTAKKNTFVCFLVIYIIVITKTKSKIITNNYFVIVPSLEEIGGETPEINMR